MQPEWRALLEASIARGGSNHWLGWLHLGVMKMEDLDAEGAREAWETSIELRPSAWALRNLAVLKDMAGKLDEACDLMRLAWEAGPQIAAIAVEYTGLLEKVGRWEDMTTFVSGIAPEIAANERILLSSGKIALHFGDFSRVDDILSHEFCTIREGETILTDLWFAMQERRIAERDGVEITEELRSRVRRESSPPTAIDFRVVG